MTTVWTQEPALTQLDLPGLTPAHRGKVREMFDLGDHMLMVATDRISAFDCILPTGIPGKGKVLSALSVAWFHAPRTWLPITTFPMMLTTSRMNLRFILKCSTDERFSSRRLSGLTWSVWFEATSPVPAGRNTSTTAPSAASPFLPG